MRKFKVGDRVKINNTENVRYNYNGKEATVIYVEADNYNGKLVYNLSVEGRFLWAKEGWLSLISRFVPEMTDDEIYDMLKPKMEKMGIDSNGTMTAVTMNDYGTAINHYMPIEDVKRIVATVYRSGYGRGQKGRPFVIGKKKKQGGHWVPCEHGEELAPGTKKYFDKWVEE